MKSPYDILRKPIVTEKSVDVKERHRTLCFQVVPEATKIDIKEAVQTLFKLRWRPSTPPLTRVKCGAGEGRSATGRTGRRRT